ncbi:MAG TPA: aminotransferase class III-fold pyridoxal phosphate-dependent enzyme [Gemmataceae bacterium]|nr:aminotransferase class III-fold pyridoxal phosphate-dependent enzyme [Gemmataceae bacterium]
MTPVSIAHPGELASNAERASAASYEPRSLRTYTPSQAVIARSAGVYHWTPEGRRLYDFTSGVLVSNLGHNPVGWTRRFFHYMGWPADGAPRGDGYFPALPMTAYNAVTLVETEASKRLVNALRQTPGGARLDQVMWAASGSEAIQKALWAGLARDKTRPIILATRYGFHGKKGLAGAVTGTEHDAERDPRVRFISFPMRECIDIDQRGGEIDLVPYRKELEQLRKELGRKLGVLITEPYLGGGGSFHPPKAYLQMLQQFCRDSDLVFILDEVQANFGRTGKMFAFETYELEPDLVVLGKGLGNGVPVAAAVGRKDLFASLDYGEGSDTWSANPLCCAAVLATLDEFEAQDVIGQTNKVSPVIEEGLVRLKRLPFVAHVRGEKGGMVWGVETKEFGGRTAAEWAEAIVLACYRGDGKTSDGIHLLGPLAKKVVRVSPPLVITEAEARTALDLMSHLLEPLPARAH